MLVITIWYIRLHQFIFLAESYSISSTALSYTPFFPSPPHLLPFSPLLPSPSSHWSWIVVICSHGKVSVIDVIKSYSQLGFSIAVAFIFSCILELGQINLSCSIYLFNIWAYHSLHFYLESAIKRPRPSIGQHYRRIYF